MSRFGADASSASPASVTGDRLSQSAWSSSHWSNCFKAASVAGPAAGLVRPTPAISATYICSWPAIVVSALSASGESDWLTQWPVIRSAKTTYGPLRRELEMLGRDSSLIEKLISSTSRSRGSSHSIDEAAISAMRIVSPGPSAKSSNDVDLEPGKAVPGPRITT